MAKTAANIVVGSPATVSIGAYGAGAGSAIDVGLLSGGLMITAAPEWYWSKGDQFLGDLAGTKFNEVFTFEFILAESSQANLTYAFGYPTDAETSGTFDVGGNATGTIREVFIVGNGPSDATRTITIHRCIITGSTEYQMLKDGQVGMKVEGRMLQDTSKASNKQYFSVVDAGGDTTPPTVVMTTPAEDGTVSAASTDTITLTFTEADSAMDESTLIYGDADKATIMIMNVEDPTQTVLVAATISYTPATKVLVITPDSVWAAATENYQIIITTGVRDTAGNYLASVFLGHFVTV